MGQAEVLDYLAQNPEWHSSREIGCHFKQSPDAIKPYLARLRRKGLIERRVTTYPHMEYKAVEAV